MILTAPLGELFRTASAIQYKNEKSNKFWGE